MTTTIEQDVMTDTSPYDRFCELCGIDMGDDPPYRICGICDSDMIQEGDGENDEDECLDCCPMCGSDYCTWDGAACHCFHCGYMGKWPPPRPAPAPHGEGDGAVLRRMRRGWSPHRLSRRGHEQPSRVSGLQGRRRDLGPHDR